MKDSDRSQAMITALRESIDDPAKSWVLFRNGTFVVFTQPESDLAEQAKLLLSTWGVVQEGTESADFGVFILDNGLGCVVTCHHEDIMTFVGPDECPRIPDEFIIGSRGRNKRTLDATELSILHIEDNRRNTSPRD